ncbi:O-antigen polymerase [Arcobacter porcinus]|uniref:O-antigen polymerase n=1 Tax=Arcobacter porcinus TaxID=1935204 RepID=UPI0008262CAF|nr:O-antigen polymerase [Arcobacter porcinus]OCL85612.1 O-Antigen ligase [Arcobacter porcinus]
MIKNLEKGHIEFFYVFYLLSGFIKGFLIAYGIYIPIDITLVGILILSIYIIIALFDGIKLSFKLIFICMILFLFYGWMIFSSIYTSSENYWLEKNILFITNIIAFLFPFILGKYFNVCIFFKYFIIITSILNIFFMQYIFPYIYQNLEFYSVGGSYLFVSLYSGINIILLCIFKINFKYKYLTYFIISVNFYTLFTSGGRAGIIFTSILLIFYYLLKIKNFYLFKFTKIDLVKTMIFTFLTTFIVILFYLYNNSSDKLQTIERTGDRLILLLDSFSNKSDDSMNERYKLISFSIDEIFSSLDSFLFGKGIGSFSIEYNGDDGRNYPHNIILEILFELGMIGMIIFFIFYFSIIKNIRQNIYFFLIVYITLHILKSSGLTDLRLFFAILSIAILDSYNKKINKEKDE